jgi:type VI secretion system secreted protein VgrG
MPTVTQEGRLFAVETELGEDVLLVDSFTGSEEMSRPFRFDIRLLADIESGQHSSVDPEALIGKKMTLRVELCSGAERFFSGLVRRFSTTDRDKRFVYYHAEVVPWLAFLQHSSNCRIFQKMTVPEILKQVFAAYQGTVKDLLTRSYEKRDYCAQYRETDFQFVSRLMEQEGIFYFFEHPQDAKDDANAYEHHLVLMDSPAYKECPNQAMVRFFGEAGYGERDDVVTSWEAAYELASSHYTLRDFHHEAPSSPYHVEMPALKPFDTAANLRLYDYPGEFAEPFNEPSQRLGKIRTEGDAAVRLAMEAEEANQLTYTAASFCRAFSPGYKFKVMNLPGNQGTSGPYLLTSVQHTGVQSPGYVTEFAPPEPYKNTFASVPAEVPYRPLQRTPKPVVHGLQTARVVDERSTGGAAEEIWPDKFGRVRVQFHWDRDAKFSCWLRVAQPWAGKGWGWQWIPRVGDEVVVDFLEGDPDCPLIVGSVYNSENMPMFSLPANKTQSGLKTRSSPDGGESNTNIFRFEDKKGKEQVFLQAEKQLDLRVKADRFETIGGESHLIVEKKQYELVKEDQHLQVKGDKNEKVTGATSLTTGEYHEKANTLHAVDAGQEIHLKGGMKVVIEAGMQLSLKVGGNFVDIGPAGVSIQGTMVMINSGGAAGSGSGASPGAPVDPKEAETGKTAGGQPAPAAQPQRTAQSATAATMQAAARDGVPFCDI